MVDIVSTKDSIAQKKKNPKVLGLQGIQVFVDYILLQLSNKNLKILVL